MPGPNVLLVVFDTARADAFDPWSGRTRFTPTVADLASRGMAVPVAISPANWTLPSHASMFTGMLPGPLGLARTGVPTGEVGLVSRPILEANRDRVLAAVLADAGYATGAVSANPWIHPIHGFAAGFERFESIEGDRRHPAGSRRSQVEAAYDLWHAHADSGARKAGMILRRWLAERRATGGDQRPFFWFVNLMECHSPYAPPRPWNDLGPLARALSVADARFQTPEGLHKVSVGDLDLPAGAAERMRHLYLRSVQSMDDWLGGLLGDLDGAGVLDDTMVIVTSDHGENLGEGHLLGHTLSMADRLIHVPWVIAGPDAVHLPPLTSTAGLPAVIASAVGLEDDPWTEHPPVPPGIGLSQTAGQVLLPEKEGLAKAWGLTDEGIRRMASAMTAATDGHLKVVRTDDGDRLYDLDADPDELRPLPVPTAPGDVRARVAKELVAALDKLDADTEAASARAIELAAAAPVHEVDPGLEHRMRALGYL